MRIAWVTLYGKDKLWDPALRLRRWNVHNIFKDLGIDSEFFWECESIPNLYEKLLDFDVIVENLSK